MADAAGSSRLFNGLPGTRPAVLRYAVAAGVSLASILLRAWLVRTFGGRFVFLPFLPALVISAWYGGLGPGLLATALTSGFSGYVLLTNESLPGAGGRAAELVNWLFFTLMGAVISFVFESMHRHRADALASAASTLRAEETVRQSEERLRLALEAGKLGVWDWDITTGKVTWSPRVYELHGVTSEGFDGTVDSFRRIVHPDDAQRVGEAIGRSVKTLEPYRIEFRVVWPSDGSMHWLWTEGRVLADASGKPVRMLGATTDITPRKLAEQEREQLLASERAARSEAEYASRMKDEFLATLSHELRTPLTSILGWSQLLRASGARADQADLVQGLEAIERNSRVQAQLVEDLLDMSRIISGKLRLEMQRVELVPVIEAAVETVRPAAEAKGITLQRQFDPDAGIAWGDPNRLQQVVWNLLSNAIKFTPSGGELRIALRRNANDVQIEVSDTGGGIDANFLPHVFERFRQADSSSTRKHGGLGLGLAIVRHLVELHGGTVSAHSDGPGQGASFRVALPGNLVPTQVPRTLEVSRAGPTPLEKPAEPTSLAGVKVLVVDDEPDARLLVQRLLEERHATVTTAGSTDEAIDAFVRDRPHVLISDIGMPDHDGYDLIGEIRRRESQGGERDGCVPALALTAFAREEDRLAALRAGYQMHLSKPVEPTQLAASVAALSGRS